MITHSRLLEALDYDPLTGVFIWKIKIKKMNPGDIAGRTTLAGYRQIKIDRKSYFAHRLAWFYVTGSMPKHQIDHINLVKDDNRFDNLREATVFQNSANRPILSRGRHGLQGVAHRPRHKSRPWEANYKVKRKTIYLGHFKTKEEAHQAYLDAVFVHRDKCFSVVTGVGEAL